jgi:hypothetical protein
MKKTLRTQKVSLDYSSSDDEPWIDFIIQQIEMTDDYSKTLNVVDSKDRITMKLTKAEESKIKSTTLSAAVLEIANTKIAEKYKTKVDPIDGLIKVK